MNLKPLAEGLRAYTCEFDEALLDEIRASYLESVLPYLSRNPHLLEGGFYRNQSAGDPGDYFIVSYDTYPLLWLSSNGAHPFDLYQRFFEGLNFGEELRHLLDYKRKVVMYCGFLVIGDRAPEAMWHYDFRTGAQGFTLITPLFELAPEHGHLLYRDADKQAYKYTYRTGEAILLGEQFSHTTEPYGEEDRPGPLRVLVSLTFGSDKWEHWEKLQPNIAGQSHYFAQPCGHISGSCKCEQRYQLRKKIWDYIGPA